MKKTFELTHPKVKYPRLVDGVKNDVRKYVKRERRKDLPEGVDFWDFDCKFGDTEAEANAKEALQLWFEAHVTRANPRPVTVLLPASATPPPPPAKLSPTAITPSPPSAKPPPPSAKAVLPVAKPSPSSANPSPRMEMLSPPVARVLPSPAKHSLDGDSMFVGFDSQNTSHSFLHYPNWNLWVSGIPIIRFRGWSEN
mgnify:CR=1 FL=1